MSTVSFDVSELNRLAAELTDAGKRVGAAVATVVAKSAADIERDAKLFAPVDTGFLKSSIGVTIIGGAGDPQIEAIIGPTASYGVYLEFGTSVMAPRAFMGPALDRNSPAFVEAVAQAAGDEFLP